jgi:hypothetical protein
MQDSENKPDTGNVLGSGSQKPSSPKPLWLTVRGILALVSAVGAVAWLSGSWMQINEWEPKYDDLKARYDEIREDYQALDTENARLTSEYQTLDTENTRLIQESLKRNEDYFKMVGEVSRRLGDSCDDAKSFVAPSDAAVAAKVLAITGGYSSDTTEQWADYYALYSWVVQNIDYVSDTWFPELPPALDDLTLSWQKDYWRMPSETIEDGAGDCEDMACLLASMIMNYTSGAYPVWVITGTSPTVGHAAVAFPVAGGRLTILDPAGNFFTRNPVPSGPIGSQPVATAVSQWLEHWSESPNTFVAGIFSDTACETFIDTDEFVLWVTEQYGS